MKKLLLIFLIIFLVVLMCITFIISLELIPKKTNDIKDYLKIEDSSLPEFIVFPASVENLSNCKYFCNDYGLIDGTEIYLEVTYDLNEFQKEVERLKNIKYESQKFNFVEEIRFDDKEKFNYPTYYSEYNSRGTYEYASIDENTNSIVYIVIYNMSIKRISIPRDFLPINYDKEIDVNNETEYYRFSIYSWPSDGKE